MDSLEELSAEDRMIVRDVMKSHGYTELTKTQDLAFSDNILSENNHLLVAETGNGKTLCAEAITKKRLDEGGQVAYLVPSRQLVRDKRDTVREWADSYDVRSGSQKYHTADVAVATFASFYRAVLQDIGNARSFDLVVLDDFHEIYGSFLGPEIEKSIAAILDEDIEIFAMSATIGNPQEIGDWIDADVTVSPEGRQIDIKEETVEYSGGSKKKHLADFVSNNTEQAPFLVFNFAKSWTESRAEAIADTGAFADMASDGHEDALESKVDGELSPKLESLADMLSKGVAYHHSDLPNPIREYIEDLYYEHEIGCLCATTTIAYGFDAPVQSVVVADMKRRGQWVGVWEYQQWIGRAARPGYGYDVGYAYTVTKNPEEVKQQYFEPRRLEPVETHIENDARFRKLVLELIATGWNTPNDLEQFVKRTLYWSQLSSEGSWGQDFGATDQLLKDKLTTTTHWLNTQGFAEEQKASGKFAASSLGSGSVEFLFDTFGSHTLSDIKKFYEWIRTTSEITPFTLVSTAAEFFGPTVNTKNVSPEFEERLQKEGYQPTDANITAGILHWYWIENEPTEAIDEETGIDSSYIYSTARSMAGVLEASINLFAATSDTPAPRWLDEYITRLEKGVRRDEIAVVENIRGLGRYRVRNLRDYLTDTSVPAVSSLQTDGELQDLLQALYDDIGDEQKFTDVLRGNIRGIGPATADAIVEFIDTGDTNTSKAGGTEEPEEKWNRDESTDETTTDSNEKESSSGNSTLDDWT